MLVGQFEGLLQMLVPHLRGQSGDDLTSPTYRRLRIVVFNNLGLSNST